jgi:Uma2 family endonuclease
LTLEEFYELVDEDTNAELVDGVIVMGFPASTPHETLADFLHRLVGMYVEQEGLGQVLGSRSVIRITGHKGREPDVIFIQTDRLGILHQQDLAGPPDLAMEIISPDDTSRDIIAQQAEYEDLGVREYWQVDQPHQTLTVFVRGEEERFVPVEADAEGRVHSIVLPGFWLRESWLWCEPGKFPSVTACLQEIRGAATVAAEMVEALPTEDVVAALVRKVGPAALEALLRQVQETTDDE